MRLVSGLVASLSGEWRSDEQIAQVISSQFVKSIRRFVRYVTRYDAKLIDLYLRSDSEKKLHIGSGHNKLSGWLNSDIDPIRNTIILDATHKFPFEANTLDYIYSEHSFEHLPFNGGQSMLKECYRVLKPGGTLRLATPDVRFLFDLYHDDRTPLQNDYIEWTSSAFLGERCPHTALGVINNYVRDWGHTFIYDEETLHASLKAAGFEDIVPAKIAESERQSLRGLENRSPVPEPSRFYALETIIFEATKH